MSERKEVITNVNIQKDGQLRVTVGTEKYVHDEVVPYEVKALSARGVEVGLGWYISWDKVHPGNFYP